MKLTIEKIEKKPTATGKDRWIVFADGQRFSVWDAGVAQSMSAGLVIDADITERNGFKNIKGFSTTGQREEVTSSVSPTMSRDQLIVAQTLTKCASEIFAHSDNVTGEQFMAICKMVVAGFNQISDDLLS